MLWMKLLVASLWPQVPRFDTRPVLVRSVVDKATLGEVSVWVLSFLPCEYHWTSAPYVFIYHWCCLILAAESDSESDTNLLLSNFKMYPYTATWVFWWKVCGLSCFLNLLFCTGWHWTGIQIQQISNWPYWRPAKCMYAGMYVLLLLFINSMLHYHTSVILHAWFSHLHKVWCWHKQFIYHMCV
jgi:hypothetical protein